MKPTQIKVLSWNFKNFALIWKIYEILFENLNGLHNKNIGTDTKII